MPVMPESCLCVSPSLCLDPRRQTLGKSSSLYSGNASRQGTESDVSTNPNGFRLSMARAMFTIGPMNLSSTVSVGCFLVCACICHLNQFYPFVRHLPYCHIRGLPLLYVTMVAVFTQPAIIRPISPYRPMKLHVSDKVSQVFSYVDWQSVNLFQGPSHNLHCPYHGLSYTKYKYHTRVIYEFTTCSG